MYGLSYCTLSGAVGTQSVLYRLLKCIFDCVYKYMICGYVCHVALSRAIGMSSTQSVLYL